jgi:hypothetical protein
MAGEAALARAASLAPDAPDPDFSLDVRLGIHWINSSGQPCTVPLSASDPAWRRTGQLYSKIAPVDQLPCRTNLLYRTVVFNALNAGFVAASTPVLPSARMLGVVQVRHDHRRGIRQMCPALASSNRYWQKRSLTSGRRDNCR